MRLTPVGKFIVFLVVIGVAIGAWRFWGKLAPEAATKPTTTVTVGTLPTAPTPGDSTPPVSVTPVVAGAGGCTDKPEVRLLGYAWNAQMGMHLANGGARA